MKKPSPTSKVPNTIESDSSPAPLLMTTTTNTHAEGNIPASAKSPVGAKIWRIIVNGFTDTAVAIEPAFNYFMAKQVYGIVLRMLGYTEIDIINMTDEGLAPDTWLKIGGLVTTLILCGKNFVLDVSGVVNPTEDAEYLLNLKSKLKEAIHKANLSSIQTKTTLALTILTIVAAEVGSFFPLAITSDIPIMEDWIPRSYPITAYTLSSGVALLGMFYYSAFTLPAIVNSWVAFSKNVFTSQSSLLLDLAKTPARSLQVIKLATANALIRGTLGAFGVYNFFTDGIKEPEKLVLGFTSLTFLFTIFVTLFSRTLRADNKYRNSAFDSVTPEEYALARPSKAGVAVDVLTTALETLPIGALYWSRAQGNMVWSESALIIIAMIALAIQSFTAGWQFRKLTAAIETKAASTPAPVENLDELSSEQLFDKIMAHFAAKKRYSWTATEFNAAARTARFISFIASLYGVLVVMENYLQSRNMYSPNLNLFEVVCLSLMIGVAQSINDFFLFNPNAVDGWTYQRTKIYLHSNFADEIPFSKWTAFWATKNGYPQGVLLAALNQLKAESANSSAVAINSSTTAAQRRTRPAAARIPLNADAESQSSTNRNSLFVPLGDPKRKDQTATTVSDYDSDSDSDARSTGSTELAR